jgi:hypothetical protein
MKKLFSLITVLLLSGHCCEASLPTDHFRSVQNGDWGSLATWESAPDGLTWSAATLIPTSAANAITIRTHTVTISTNQDMDQVLIRTGSILQHNGGTLTVNDGMGDDIVVENWAVFHINVNPAPVFSGAATMRINFGAILRLSVSGLTGAGTGVNASNYVYDHNAILEYTLPLAFSTAGVTYFPNVGPATIPVFRTTSNIGIVGSNSTTTFNGVFEANGNITFANSGQKIFRNGIIGTGNIDGSTSGKFIINGNTGVLGGTGTLTLPAVDGMDIGNATSCNVISISNKTVNNNIALANNVYLILLGEDLIMNGLITGGSTTAHVATIASGRLVINNIGPTPVSFPVGPIEGTFNPMYISNGGGLNYGVRVEIGINPPIGIPLKAVNRTWFVTPSGGTPGTVNTDFFYSAGHANAGFNYAANIELGQHTGVWNVIQTGLVPTGSYQLATTVSTFGNGIEAPLVLANLGAILTADHAASVDHFTGVKQNNRHILSWKLSCSSTSHVTVDLQRSVDSRNFATIFSEDTTAMSCRQPFNYTDNQPASGVNYYRLKMTDADGKISYSSIVSLINAAKGFEIMNIAPNPVVNGAFNLKLSAAEKMQMELVITDMQGRVLDKRSVSLAAGFNSIPVNVGKFAAGTYQLFGNTAGGRTRVLRFVINL